MGVTVEWHDNDRKVILMCFMSRWTWEQAHEAVKDANAMLDTVNYKVDFVIYAESEAWMPPNYNFNVARMTRVIHPNAGLMVIVSTNTLFRQLFFVFRAVNRGASFAYRMVPSLDAAFELLSEPSK